MLTLRKDEFFLKDLIISIFVTIKKKCETDILLHEANWRYKVNAFVANFHVSSAIAEWKSIFVFADWAFILFEAKKNKASKNGFSKDFIS